MTGPRSSYRFVREARTPHSESYAIEDSEHALGRVDLHYTSSATYATLAVHLSLDDEAVQALVAEIDDQLVATADPYREDLIVTVWRGEEAGLYHDEDAGLLGDEIDDDDTDDDDDDGDAAESDDE